MMPAVPFEPIAIAMLVSMVSMLLLGFPVALTLIAHGFLFLAAGWALGFYPPAFLYAQVLRVYGIAYNDTLLAIPFFTLMGMLLERSGIAEDLLRALGDLLAGVRGGLGYAVVVVGVLLACTTGVVQASILAMGLISLPSMLARGYPATLSCGVIAASATLAQVIPPSLVLIVLAEAVGVPVVTLYDRALVPGLLLAGAYLLVVAVWSRWARVPVPPPAPLSRAALLCCLRSVVPPLLVIACTTGSMLAGVAAPTESGAFGAVAALALVAWRRRLTLPLLRQSADATLLISCAAMFILVGANFFILPFRGMDGDVWLARWFTSLPAGQGGFLVAVTLLVFVLAFFLDFFELSFIVVPLIGPVADKLGIDLVWFGVLLAVNMQTSFMHPPFGFALFYLRSVAAHEDYTDKITKKPIAKVTTGQIYWGAVPFVIIQIIMVALVIAFPNLVSGGLGKKADLDTTNLKIEATPSDYGDKKEENINELFGLPEAASAPKK
jgi:tripartite ATP-independent transporter DctM subunit